MRKKRYICDGKKGVNMLKYNKLSIHEKRPNSNPEISVGGNLSLPIGKTDTIRLSRMIEEGDVLHVIDGKYVINKADNISENIDAIDPVVIDDFAPDFKPYTRRFETQTVEIPDIPGLEVPDIEVEFEADIHMTENFNINTEIPTEVKAVKSIKVTDNNGQTLHTTLDITISGMPVFLPRLYLVGVELQFRRSESKSRFLLWDLRIHRR